MVSNLAVKFAFTHFTNVVSLNYDLVQP